MKYLDRFSRFSRKKLFQVFLRFFSDLNRDIFVLVKPASVGNRGGNCASRQQRFRKLGEGLGPMHLQLQLKAIETVVIGNRIQRNDLKNAATIDTAVQLVHGGGGIQAVIQREHQMVFSPDLGKRRRMAANKRLTFVFKKRLGKDGHAPHKDVFVALGEKEFPAAV